MGAARWLPAPAKPLVLDSLAGMGERIATMAGGKVVWLSWLIRHVCPESSQIPASTVNDFRPTVGFFQIRHGATAAAVAAAYRHFLTHLKISSPPVHGASLGIHFRGLHHSARAKAGDFATWCLAHARSRGVTRCFAVADTDRETLASVLENGGLDVVWGRSSAMTSDLDRSSLDATKDFIGDALALADCDTVLISFAESTVADTARAFGREVIAYYGSREWSECWFQHCR